MKNSVLSFCKKSSKILCLLAFSLGLLLLGWTVVWAQEWNLVRTSRSGVRRTGAIHAGPQGQKLLFGSFETALNLGDTVLKDAGENASPEFIASWDVNGALNWAVAIQGLEANRITALSTDAEGNVYAGGFFKGLLQVGQEELACTIYASDMFLLKLDTNGQVLWVRQLPSVDQIMGTKARGLDDRLEDLAISSTGEVWCVGNTKGRVDFGQGHQAEEGPFVAAFSPDGQAKWVRMIGNKQGQVKRVMATPTKQIYLAGDFSGSFTSTGNGKTFHAQGKRDVFLAALGVQGKVEKVHVFSGPGLDQVKELSEGADGRIYLAGLYQQTIGIGDHQLQSPGGMYESDVFVFCMAPNGLIHWANDLQGIDDESVGGMVADEQGNCLLAGSFTHSVSCQGKQLEVTGNLGSKDIFMATWNKQGKLLGLEQYRGGNDDWVTGLSQDGRGHVLMSGTFQRTLELGDGVVRSRAFQSFFWGTFPFQPIKKSQSPDG